MLKMMKTLRVYLTLLLLLFLVSCGGGGGSSGTTNSGNGTSGSANNSTNLLQANSNVSTILLDLDPASVLPLNANGTSKLVFRVKALNANNAIVENAVIKIAGSDGLVINKSTVTIPKIEEESTIDYATFNVSASSSNQLNRTATVTASCESCSAASTTYQVVVKGAVVSLQSPSASSANILLNQTNTMSVVVRSVTGIALSNVPVIFKNSSKSIFDFNEKIVTTNSNGIASITFKGVEIGEEAIYVEALADINQFVNFKVNPETDALLFLWPSDTKKIVVQGSTSAIKIKTPSNTKNVLVTSSQPGAITGGPVFTPINREIEFNFRPQTTGAVTIQAVDQEDASKSDTLNLSVSSSPTSVTSINLNVDRTTVPVSTATTTNNIKIEARALNAAGQGVANVPVSFQIQGEQLSGDEKIFPLISFTDATGIAKSTFSAGTQSSSLNGIKIIAYASNDPSIRKESTVFVGGKGFSVAFGFASEIKQNEFKTTYIRDGTVLVSDSSGNPVPNTLVTLRLRPYAFSTGPACFNPPANVFTYCSEDRNKNGSLDANEDGFTRLIANDLSDRAKCEAGSEENDRIIETSKDGLLTPSNSAGGAVTSSVTTNQQGVAEFNVTYLKLSALWVVNELTATISSAGTETTASIIFRLAATKEDAGDECKLDRSPYVR